MGMRYQLFEDYELLLRRYSGWASLRQQTCFMDALSELVQRTRISRSIVDFTQYMGSSMDEKEACQQIDRMRGYYRTRSSYMREAVVAPHAASREAAERYMRLADLALNKDASIVNTLTQAQDWLKIDVSVSDLYKKPGWTKIYRF